MSRISNSKTSGRNVFDNNSSSANYCAITDMNAFQDRNVSLNLNMVIDDVRGHHSLIKDISEIRVRI